MNFKYDHRAKYPPRRLSFGKKDGNGPGIPALPSSRRSRATGSVQSIGESYTRYRENNGKARFRVLQPGLLQTNILNIFDEKNNESRILRKRTHKIRR